MDDRLFNFQRLIKNLSNVDHRKYMNIDDYKPKTETKYKGKKELLVF